MFYKKVSLLILLAIFLLSACPASAQLQYFWGGAPRVGDVYDIVTNIEYTVGFLFGAVAVICFVMAGILFLTAQGEPEKLKTAKAATIWGFVGVAVGIIAFSIVGIVARVLS
jgi:hypothetical protein